MSVVRLQDIIEPDPFTAYIINESMKKTALVRSGVATRNDSIREQLNAGAHSFTVPYWRDLADTEADLVNDDPAINSTPGKLTSGKQIVRKAFLHASWSAMNLASEIAGADALARIQTRVEAYWSRQMQARLIGTLTGVQADNAANDSGDMIVDISAETGAAANFSAAAVIDTAGTLGDSMESLSGIAMHSAVYRQALKNDLIEFVQPSSGGRIATFRNLAVIVDDGLTDNAGAYTSVLFGQNAIGYSMAEPRIAAGTEVENLPSAGMGGGQQILHSRVNVAMHPAGFTFKDALVAEESPSVAELAEPTNWDRTVERKSVPLAFLVSKVAA